MTQKALYFQLFVLVLILSLFSSHVVGKRRRTINFDFSSMITAPECAEPATTPISTPVPTPVSSSTTRLKCLGTTYPLRCERSWGIDLTQVQHTLDVLCLGLQNYTFPQQALGTPSPGGFTEPDMSILMDPLELIYEQLVIAFIQSKQVFPSTWAGMDTRLSAWALTDALAIAEAQSVSYPYAAETVSNILVDITTGLQTPPCYNGSRAAAAFPLRTSALDPTGIVNNLMQDHYWYYLMYSSFTLFGAGLKSSSESGSEYGFSLYGVALSQTPC